jgi:hypothetical protein
MIIRSRLARPSALASLCSSSTKFIPRKLAWSALVRSFRPLDRFTRDLVGSLDEIAWSFAT